MRALRLGVGAGAVETFGGGVFALDGGAAVAAFTGAMIARTGLIGD